MRWIPLLPAVCALALSVGCAAEDEPEVGVSFQEIVETTATSFRAVGTVEQEQNHHYTVPLPLNASNISIDLSGNGDGDLYSLLGAQPSETDYECRPFQAGTEEACYRVTGSGDLGIMVRGWAPVSDYELSVEWDDGIGTSPGPAGHR